ncbi:unnamed protein product [Darwinula stevensoni]|uniref:Transmembrane protein 222 n=1 Tax=Darwinula stevensoni TaxID=69355 RepID=A0A7R9A7E1_9CRUS|nr:unnamed protein product [Darwinula stevensoni]CAG0892923.1 unnamed protein product [Darwinula stevensoni]
MSDASLDDPCSPADHPPVLDENDMVQENFQRPKPGRKILINDKGEHILESGHQSQPDEEHSEAMRHRHLNADIDFDNDRFPFSLVWTSIPLLTWFFPFIGHMGIATSNGIIRDFAGPYMVSEDQMAFGRPMKYVVMDPLLARGGADGWDRAIFEASEEYKTRMHNLCWDNCHSHVGMALSLMEYDGGTHFSMVYLVWLFIVRSKYVRSVLELPFENG